MKKKFKDDTFLARWLSNELSDEELKDFQESEDFAMFEKIVSGSRAIRSESFDEHKILERIKESQPSKVRPLYTRRVWLYGAAASVVLVLTFALFNIFSKPTLIEVASGKGEKKTIFLPDGSEVILNANSVAAYIVENWDENRFVDLRGEAYFKVKTGNQFTVRTASGSVSVLGTQFNVQAINGFFEVKCFEGSVQVQSENDEEVLKPKRAFRRINRNRAILTSIVEGTPSWINNESVYTRIPFKYVLIGLENQYDIVFEGKTAADDLTFSGTFPHDDLDLALKVVLGSLQINYTVNGKTVVLED